MSSTKQPVPQPPTGSGPARALLSQGTTQAVTQPNHELARWFARTGWSHTQLAALVTQRARALGAEHLHPDAHRVRGWIGGEQPRQPVPRILVELFNERLGCFLTEEDLCLPREAPLFDAWYPGTPEVAGHGGARGSSPAPGHPRATVDLLGDIVRSDLARAQPGFLDASESVSTGLALLGTARRWLAADADPSPDPGSGAGPSPDPGSGVGPAGPAGSVQLSEDELTQLETTARVFADPTELPPGGLRRAAVIGQLYELTELLRCSYPEDVARRLFGTVAQLAALAGTMSHDDGLDAAAQKYFILALHAAKQAGDRALGGEIVSRMAQQLIQLGHPHDALALIECARTGSAASASASIRSLFLLVEAWSYAHLGEVDACHRAVGSAEEAFACSRVHEEPPWLTFGAADLVGMAGYAYRVLSEFDPRQTAHAEPLLRRSLELRGPDDVRARALSLIDLAITYLLAGRPDRAGSAGEEAMLLVDRLRQSVFLLDHVRALHRQAERYDDVPAIRRLTRRLTDVLAPTAAPARYLGETTTPSVPGPVWAPTTAPSWLT